MFSISVELQHSAQQFVSVTMFLPQNDISEIVLRQRKQKEELSKAIAKNQTKLTQVQQEIRFLTQPLNMDYTDECERLDDEIDKLGRVCEAMSNEYEKLKRMNEPAMEHRQTLRPAPPPPPHPPPRTRPHNLFPNKAPPSPMTSLSPQSPASRHGQSPSSPSQQLQQEQTPVKSNNENDTSDPPDCNEQPWQCSMCTLQNHPLLNKCEACDNVRILPGSIKIVPSRPSPPAPVGSRSAPQTPGTPMSGPASARLLTLPNDFPHRGVTTSNSEGSLPHFAGDVII